MGKRTEYGHGTFCWIELATPDPAAAKAFYGELFGWALADDPIPGTDDVYTMARIGGDDVAGIMRQMEDQRAAGVPPAWLSYLSVDSADQTCAQAGELGGTVLAEPFDVTEAGRMAVLADPTGAAFAVWQPRQHIGAGIVNVPGSLTWNELATTDVPAAIRFYESLLGWRVEEIDTGGGPRYWTIGHEPAAAGRNGGIRELPPEQAQAGVPPHWLPYLAVESAQETLARATELGAHPVIPVTTIPTGTFLAFQDPSGAALAVFAGEFDD